MSKQYDISRGQNNPTFLGDDGKIFVPALELELSEKKAPKDDGDYDPYLHRNVEHPTSYELKNLNRKLFGYLLIRLNDFLQKCRHPNPFAQRFTRNGHLSNAESFFQCRLFGWKYWNSYNRHNMYILHTPSHKSRI